MTEVRRTIAVCSMVAGLMAATLAAAYVMAAEKAVAHPLPGAPNCPVFPRNNPWNQRIDRAPVAADSATLIQAIGGDSPLHAAFGSGKWDGVPVGIPYVVTSSRPRVRVHFEAGYAPRAYNGAYPLHPGVPIEVSDTDHHVIIVDRRTCRDYELFNVQHVQGNIWQAAIGVVFNMFSDALRPQHWPSADASGMPILPGLARWSDVHDGSIDHALRFSAPRTQAAFIYPATDFGAGTSDPSLPPMGTRVRLKASVDLSHLPYQARVIALALKRYGMILADNGPAWFISGVPDRHWRNLALATLERLKGSDFEVVNTSGLPHPGS